MPYFSLKNISMKKLPEIPALLKSYFFTGALVLLPFGVIGWILLGVLELLWDLPKFLPADWQPEQLLHNHELALLLNLGFMLACTFVLALAVSFMGWISRQYLGQKVIDLLGEFIDRIPVVRSIYSALDQLIKTMASGNSSQFNRVVYVEYPRAGSWTLAFVTGSTHLPFQKGNFLNLYVPTTPNPTSGFYIIVAEDQVRDAHLKVEDAFKTILSLGIAQGTQKNNRDRPHE